MRTSYGAAIARNEGYFRRSELIERGQRERDLAKGWHAKAADSFGAISNTGHDQSTGTSSQHKGVTASFETRPRIGAVVVLTHNKLPGLSVLVNKHGDFHPTHPGKIASGSLMVYADLIAAAVSAHRVLAKHAP